MPTEEQCREAVHALYRVRAVEKPAELDGHREVWHQGSKGCELLSTVDAKGVVEEQELTLFNEVFYWRNGARMKTGKLVGNADVTSKGNILWDAEPALLRLERCHKAMASYDGKDAYLLHFREAIAATLAGIDWNDAHVVTAPARPGQSQENPIPVNPDGTFKRLVRGITSWGKKSK